MTSRILAVANQKGGVGKTTVTLSLAAAIANSGRRVLVVDMDPQANASQTLLADFDERVTRDDFFTVNDIMEASATPEDLPEAIYPTLWDGVDLIASQQALAHRDGENTTGIQTRLRRMLRGLDAMSTPYDVVLLDCPPSVGNLTVNAFVAAREVLLVVEPDLYGRNALHQVSETLATVRDSYEHAIDIVGLVINKVGDNNEAKRRTEELMDRYHDTHVCVIRRRAALFTESAVANESIFTSPRRDSAEVADWFTALARELRLIGAREAVPVAAGHLTDAASADAENTQVESVEAESAAGESVEALVAASHPAPFDGGQSSAAVGY